MIKKSFFLFVFLLLSNCGFTPLYNSENVNYKINLVEALGDNTVNTKIINNLKRISKPNSGKVFNLKINSDYKKKIISKNIKGSTSDYQLIATVNILIIENNNVKSVTYEEKQIIKKNSDSFDQINYENTIKENFANSIVRKLNLELSRQ
tara:strand:+ start:1522 stop:1971 length:450 start_codon:yes stop_codon:yes gene_type:complete